MPLPRSLRAVVILAAFASPAVRAAELPRESEPWIQLTTGNFTFFSNASQRTARTVASDLEELRAVLAHVTALELDSPVPILVYIFRNRGSFEPYRHFYASQPVATAGYFLERNNANFIAICADAREDASSIVYHEYVHFIASANLWHLPLWFEEGLAGLYQNFEVADGKARIGLPVWRHLALLNTSPTMPLPELFAVEHDSPAYNDPSRKESFYAQSWALVHYLLIGSEPRRAETARFIALLHDGVPPSTAFAAAFSVDPAELENEFRSYIGRRRYSYLELPVTVDLTTAITIRELPYPEVLYRLGDLLSQQSPPRPEARDHFLAAVERAPSHGPSLAALGRLAEDRARWDEAESWYRRALGAAPDDPLVQYVGGSYLLRRGGDIAAARSALRRCVQADPSYAPAWAALAGSFLAAGDHSEEAILAAETAHRLLPERPDVTANLLRLYLASGRRNDSLALAERAFAADPDQLQRALRVIARSDVDRARRLIEDGRPDEALGVLAEAEAASAGIPDDELIGRHIDALRATVVDARLTERYNEAANAYNAGEVDRARELLVALRDEAPPGRHAEAVESFLAFLDNPAAGPPPAAPLAPPHATSPADIERLNQLIAANRFDEALALLEDLRSRSGPSPPLWIDVKIDDIRRVRADNAFVEAYNRAVGQFNGGAYAAAVTTIEAALAAHPESPDAEAARELLADARAALGHP
jgi:tetratricopeptide (TPR) repeat protein